MCDDGIERGIMWEELRIMRKEAENWSKFLRIHNWNTAFTGFGAVAGWLALIIVVVAVIK